MKYEIINDRFGTDMTPTTFEEMQQQFSDVFPTEEIVECNGAVTLKNGELVARRVWSDEERCEAVRGMNVNDPAAEKMLGDEMNHVYPVADGLDGTFTGECCADDQDGYVVDPTGMYAMPLAAATAAGWDDENQNWDESETECA